MNNTINKLPNGDFEVMSNTGKQIEPPPELIEDIWQWHNKYKQEAIEAYKRNLVEWLEDFKVVVSQVSSSKEAKVINLTTDKFINHIKGQ